MKTCRYCKQDKPLDDFHHEVRNLDGRQSYCKTCTRDLNRLWRQNNPDSKIKRKPYHRMNALKRLYGISVEDYDKRLAEQNGKCAICKADSPGVSGHFYIDHCHKSGKVRGLLCHNCNFMLGQAKDNIDILLAGIEYLKNEGFIVGHE